MATVDVQSMEHPVGRARLSRQKRSLPSFKALALMALMCPAACTGSPATLALQPDFAMTTPVGIASVSIRESVPSFTDSEFEEFVRTGMEQAAPNAVLSGPVQRPFPQFRIVWHVSHYGNDGASRLIVDIFKGSDPLAYEQGVIDNSAPTSTIIATVESMTKRLFVNDVRVPLAYHDPKTKTPVAKTTPVVLISKPTARETLGDATVATRASA